MEDEGELEFREEDGEGVELMECPYCDGDGETRTRFDGAVVALPCPECGGTGWL